MDSIFDNPKYKERLAMYETALAAGIPIVSADTCALICAALAECGNTEEFTHNHRLVCELRYAQERFNVKGSECVTDPYFHETLRHYVRLFEACHKENKEIPSSINEVFMTRYGFKLH